MCKQLRTLLTGSYATGIHKYNKTCLLCLYGVAWIYTDKGGSTC